MYHQFYFSRKIDLVATGTTGKHAIDAGLKVKRMLSGPNGGDTQIAAMVANHEIEVVFFFRDLWENMHMSPILQC